jgi:glycosyltransferase involved in cell wall biosynthesis
MNVWLLTIGEPLPTDAGNQRLLRTGLLSQRLAARGHQVLWWSSAFDHMAKTFRCEGEAELAVDARQTLVLLNGGGYRHNISVARWRDHARLAKRFNELAADRHKPDVIVASLPSIELALAAVRYGRRHGIPVVVDVRDLWPDVMVDLLPRFARPIGRAITLGLTKQVQECARDATAITGHAPMFVEWGVRHASRAATALDRMFPHGYPTSELSVAERARAQAQLTGRGIDLSSNLTTIVFVGTIGNQQEFEPVLEAAALLKNDARIRFVLAGTGDNIERYRRLSGTVPNIVVPGWLDRAQIRVLLEHSAGGLLPYPDRLDWIETIPNKFPEYLSAGLPVLVSLPTGRMHEFMVKYNCGFGYSHSGSKLAERVLQLANEPSNNAALKAAAHGAFQKYFRADVVYDSMSDYLEEISARAKPTS